MEWYFAYLLLGACAGFLGGLFGIGGGTILVPMLLWLFEAQHFPAEQTMRLALGTSMAVILFTALASLRKHHQHGAVEWAVVRGITPGILLGTALGASCAAIIPARGLGLVFALFVYFAALQILLDLRSHAARQLPGRLGMSAMGVFTGWISSLVSIGGGTVVIPFLVWCNVPLRHAIGTSSAISFPIALGGSLGYIIVGSHLSDLPAPHLGYVYLPALFWVALASVSTASLGAKAAHCLNIGVLRRLFAVLLLVLASKMLLRALF